MTDTSTNSALYAPGFDALEGFLESLTSMVTLIKETGLHFQGSATVTMKDDASNEVHLFSYDALDFSAEHFLADKIEINFAQIGTLSAIVKTAQAAYIAKVMGHDSHDHSVRPN
jgi:hypothetical protein